MRKREAAKTLHRKVLRPRRTTVCAGLAVCCILCTIPRPNATGQDLPLPPPAQGEAVSNVNSTTDKLTDVLARRGSLKLRNSSLEGALYTISELFGVNIVTGELDGQVNGVFTDAPLHEILDGILLSNGYGYRPAGESLVISKLSEMGQVNPFFESATIPVRAADVTEVAAGVESLRSPQGRVQAIKSARTIFVLDFPERVKMIRHIVQSIDEAMIRASGREASSLYGGAAALQVAYFRTQFVAAQTALLAVETVLSKDGRASALENEDRLVIVDYPENVGMAHRVLQRVDRPRPQVRITALIYDISVEDIEELGINWNQSLKGRVDSAGDAQTALTIDSILKQPFGPTATGSTLTFMNLSRHIDIDGVVLALQNAKDSRLLADPFVVVEENQNAIFQSVSEIPYQQLTETAAGGNIGTTAFKEAGITLRVRPKISCDGTIKMEVSPEFSTLTGFTPGDNQPIIDKRISTTILRVANKQTVVIGGLRQRSDVGDFKGVPYLKDMKYFGKLFRARSTTVRESELVVFIIPEIVGYAPPQRYREQMVMDTIGCRLDGMPLAEGCLAGADCGGAVYEGGYYTDDPSAEPELVLPVPVDQGENLPLPAQTSLLRRLPPTAPPHATLSLAHVGTLSATPENLEPSVHDPLRPAYERRFRATGGVDPQQQRVAERVVPVEPREEKEKPGFWDRIRRF